MRDVVTWVYVVGIAAIVVSTIWRFALWVCNLTTWAFVQLNDPASTPGSVQPSAEDGGELVKGKVL